MVLGFGQAKGASPAKTKPDDVAALIARKEYAKAIALLRRQLETQKHDSRLRIQLADLLVLGGKTKEAVGILVPLADEFAREGFAAKAVAVLKKIQKIDPTQRGVDAKLASVIEEKQKQATVTAPAASAMPEFGMEEIGFEPPPPAARGPALVPEPEAAPELGLEELPLSPVAPEPEPAPAPPPRPPMPAPVEDRDLIDETAEDFPLDDATGAPVEIALEPAAAEIPLEGLPDIALAAEDDLQITAEPEVQLDPEIQLEPEAEPEPEPAAAAEPMTESLFAEELMSLVEGAFTEHPSAEDPAGASPPAGGSQIVVSPLFKDFSVDEMVAVIQGLNLITYEAGDIILTEGDPGDSLYMLTTGTVKAVKRNAAGKQVAVSEMSEGAFFGEISILTGRPRTATVVATSHCELLELDRATLDSIVSSHPHVRQVLEQFSKERLARLPRR